MLAGQLRLASEGLTDGEAAGRLLISPRAVNQHLRSLYNKPGVNARRHHPLRHRARANLIAAL